MPRVPWVCLSVSNSFPCFSCFSHVISYSLASFLFAVRVRLALGAHTFFCRFETAFRLLHVLDFWLREPVFKDGGRVFLTVRDPCGSGSQFSDMEKSVINGPGPFSLRELGFKEHCC